MKQIKNCPNCNASVGWWEKRVQSYRQYFVYDGTSDGTDDGWHSGAGKGGKRKFCYDCNRDITECIKP